MALVADYKMCCGPAPLCRSAKPVKNLSMQLPAKRTLHIAAGEGRSANRTKWSVDTAPSPPPVLQTSGTRSSGERAVDLVRMLQYAGRVRHSAQDFMLLEDKLVLEANIAACMAQVWQASQELQPIFAGIDQLTGQNLRRVQSAMRRCRIGPHHFSGSTGYGHGDLGREAFDSVS